MISAYDNAVLNDHPVFRSCLSTDFEETVDGSKLPNGERSSYFDGESSVDIPAAPELSVTRTGELSIEAWIAPEALTFSDTEGSGYVHWLGKGHSGQQEYAMRMYSQGNTENRQNRISGYAFNLSGGPGSGSYFQDPVAVNQWIYVVLTIKSGGMVEIWKDRIKRDSTPLSQFNVVPQRGTAPLRIGSRDLASFFQGSIGKVVIYDHVLPQARIEAHYTSMVTP